MTCAETPATNVRGGRVARQAGLTRVVGPTETWIMGETTGMPVDQPAASAQSSH